MAVARMPPECTMNFREKDEGKVSVSVLKGYGGGKNATEVGGEF